MMMMMMMMVSPNLVTKKNWVMVMVMAMDYVFLDQQDKQFWSSTSSQVCLAAIGTHGASRTKLVT
jgi:hypothetical protein